MSSDPYRDLDAEGVHWREGKPNYSQVNDLYEKEKSQHHPDGSLERLVEKIMKNAEMEFQHKALPKQWSTVSDPDSFWLSANGGPRRGSAEVRERGTYSCFLGRNPNYDPEGNITFKEAHDLFRGAFTRGFAFEVIKVLTGPPVVTVTWRHWAPYTGEYRGHQGGGESVELLGVTICEVDDELKIKNMRNYFDTGAFFRALTGHS